MNPQEAKKQLRAENHRERVRMSQDQIEVRNPLSTDFSFVWDGYRRTVRAGETRIMARYLAMKYARDIVNAMILLEGQKAIDAENAARKKRGQKPLDKWEEQPIIENEYRIDKEELREKFMREVIVRFVEKFGNDPMDDAEAVNQVIDRSDRDLFNDILGSVPSQREAEDVIEVSRP